MYIGFSESLVFEDYWFSEKSLFSNVASGGQKIKENRALERQGAENQATTGTRQAVASPDGSQDWRIEEKI